MSQVIYSTQIVFNVRTILLPGSSQIQNTFHIISCFRQSNTKRGKKQPSCLSNTQPKNTISNCDHQTNWGISIEYHMFQNMFFNTSVLKSHTTNRRIATVSSLQDMRRSKWMRCERSEKGSTSTTHKSSTGTDVTKASKSTTYKRVIVLLGLL